MGGLGVLRREGGPGLAVIAEASGGRAGATAEGIHFSDFDHGEATMGFNGWYLLSRGDTSQEKVNALSKRECQMNDHYGRGGGWQIGGYLASQNEFDVMAASKLLSELGADTGAPTLNGYVIDSDAVVVTGWSRESGFWRGCLAREDMRNYCDSDEEFDEECPPPTAAIDAAESWARSAGTSPDREALTELFNAEEKSVKGQWVLAEDMFFALVDALGIAESG